MYHSEDDWTTNAYREDDLASPIGSPPRGWSGVAWLVILTLVGFHVWLQNIYRTEAAPNPAVLEENRLALILIETQCRYLISARDVLPPGNQDKIEDMIQQNRQGLSQGSLAARLRFAVTLGELLGPDDARNELGLLEFQLQNEPDLNLIPQKDRQAKQLLTRLYRDYSKKKWDGPSLKGEDKEFLKLQLGWFGELALTPSEANLPQRQTLLERAHRIFYGMIGLLLGLVVFGLLGLVSLAVVLFSMATRHLQFGLPAGSGHHGLYAETFACWLFLFSLGELLLAVQPIEELRLGGTALVMFFSLLALLWPMFRGLEWSRIRADLGLKWGRAGIFEPAFGVVNYLMTLPQLALGVALMVVLIMVRNALFPGEAPAGAGSAFVSREVPSHPIVHLLLQGDWVVRAQLFFLACVAAPVVEEIMFRGVLYRHLRDATQPWTGWFLSVMISTIWQSFLFAAIHPQGLLAVPALMGLAFGMTLAREWRDSLGASMVTHALNNGLVFTMVILLVTS